MEIIVGHMFRMDLTEKCLDAIPDSNKIILIDISPKGEAKNYSENHKKHIQYVRGPGYPNQFCTSKTWNEGTKRCKDNWFMIINNDVLINNGEIKKIEEEIKNCDEKVGIIGPCREGRIPILHIGIFRRKCFDDVGWFDERFYPCAGEDQDYYVRLAKKGWKYKCIPIEYLHMEGGHHSRVESPSKQYKTFIDKWGFPPSGPEYYEIISKGVITCKK